MIYIAICDDEKHMSAHIRSCVSDFFRKKNRETSLRMFSSGEELLSYNGQIDILFLDIQMKGMDGMETARKLRADQFRGFLVFITVLKEMVFQSFEVQAYDYLVFCEVIDRKIYLNLASGDVVDYYERIENLEAKLDKHFYRCHRSYLINLKHLKGYKNGTACMDNGKKIPVSRLRSKEFSGVVLQYMKNI